MKMIEKIASRKDAKTLSLSKMRNKLFFTPTPASPIKGEEFSLPSPWREGLREGDKMALYFIMSHRLDFILCELCVR